ncbi:MAG TPA: cytochrome c family protein [Caldimonas sp.]|nr:cytochrome c family protein [Caldimonas sp.]
MQADIDLFAARARRLVPLLLLGAFAGAPACAQTSAAALPAGDPARGKTLYQGCESCHSIDENDVGPKHRGVFGRRAGTVPDYAYSPALKGSGITWNEANLDRWLVNPSAMVPGTKMFFRIDDAQARADLIAYLKQQK